MKKLICLILFILIGCSDIRVPEPVRYHYVSSGVAGKNIREYEVWIDRDFSGADRLEILAAINQWNHALNGYVRIVVRNSNFGMEPSEILAAGDGWMILRITSASSFIPDPKGVEKRYTLAWVDKILGHRMWVVRDRMYTYDLEGIMLHEMGHLLGGEHNGKMLMAATYKYEEYACVDYEALKSVVLAQGLDITKLNYCVYE